MGGCGGFPFFRNRFDGCGGCGFGGFGGFGGCGFDGGRREREVNCITAVRACRFKDCGRDGFDGWC